MRRVKRRDPGTGTVSYWEWTTVCFLGVALLATLGFTFANGFGGSRIERLDLEERGVDLFVEAETAAIAAEDLIAAVEAGEQVARSDFCVEVDKALRAISASRILLRNEHVTAPSWVAIRSGEFEAYGCSKFVYAGS